MGSEYINFISIIISLLALFFTAKKQIHEADNIDADTILKLHETIDKQDKRYDNMVLKQDTRYNELLADIEKYKKETNDELEKVRCESEKLRAGIRKLIKQLHDNHIEPVDIELLNI